MLHRVETTKRNDYSRVAASVVPYHYHTWYECEQNVQKQISHEFHVKTI